MSIKNPLQNNKPGAVIIEGHVQGLSNTRSLGEAGIPVFVVDKVNCIARYSKYCQKFFRCPDFNSDSFADFLIELAEKENIHGWVLLPSNDHAVYTISKHKAMLEQFYKIITPGLEIIDNIYDKSKLLAIAEESNVPFPKTQLLKSLDDAENVSLNYPVILKGRYGLSFYKAVGKKVLLAENENELNSQLKYIEDKYRIKDTFMQELISYNGSNHTVSFTAFCVDGEIKTYWMGEKLREHPLRFGTATFAKSIYIEDCFRQSILLLKALRYTGVCEIEYLLDSRDNKYKLIEINARTWLWVGLARACGIDFARIIFNYLCNNDENYPESYDIDKYWINPIGFLYNILCGLNKREGNFAYNLLFLFKRNKINALFVKGDLMPGFMYIKNLYYYYKER